LNNPANSVKPANKNQNMQKLGTGGIPHEPPASMPFCVTQNIGQMTGTRINNPKSFCRQIQK